MTLESLARTIAKSRHGTAIVAISAVLSGCYRPLTDSEMRAHELAAKIKDAIVECHTLNAKDGYRHRCPDIPKDS